MFNPKKVMTGGEKRQREPSPDPAPKKRIHTEDQATAPKAAPPFSPPPLKRSPNINLTRTKAANTPPPPPATAAPPNLSDKMKKNASNWANRGREAAQASTNAYSFKKEELSEPTTSSRQASTNRPETRRPETRRQSSDNTSEYTYEETSNEPSENRAFKKAMEYGERTGDVLDGVVHNSFDAADAATQVVSSALNETGEVGKSALEATGKVTSAALKETGDSGAGLVGKVAETAFKSSTDLLSGLNNIRERISGKLKKRVLINAVSVREKIINSTIKDIKQMQNVDNWVNEIMTDGEEKGWIPKKCYFFGCKGRKSIELLIRAVLQSVLLQGKNLDSLNIVQIKFERNKKVLEDIKGKINQLKTDATGDGELSQQLQNLTENIAGGLEEFNTTVSTMKVLAAPKMITIRASVTKAEEAKKRKNMSKEEQELYDDAMGNAYTLHDASPSIKAEAKTRADTVEGKEEKKLKQGVQEIQKIQKEQEGGKSKKRTRKYRKSKRRKSQKSKVFVGSNKKSRKRLGRKTKRRSR